MIIFKVIGKFLMSAFKYLGMYFRLVPAYFTGFFLIGEFIFNLTKYNFVYAFKTLALSIFGAELTINKMVSLAVIDAKSYTFISFLKILISIYILYIFVRFLVNVQIGVSGSQAEVGALLLALIVTAIISISAVVVLEGEFGFIPIRDSFIYLGFNIDSVLTGIFTSGSNIVVEPIINEIL